MPKKGKEDISGAKLMKAFEFVKKGLEEFGVKEAGWEWDKSKKAVFWFSTAKKKLPETIEWTGPPLMMENRVKEFKKKYKKTYTKKGRIFAKIKRKYPAAESMVKSLVKEKYFKEKTKKCMIS